MMTRDTWLEWLTTDLTRHKLLFSSHICIVIFLFAIWIKADKIDPRDYSQLSQCIHAIFLLYLLIVWDTQSQPQFFYESNHEIPNDLFGQSYFEEGYIPNNLIFLITAGALVVITVYEVSPITHPTFCSEPYQSNPIAF